MKGGVFARLRAFARRMQADVAAIGLAVRDPRVPWLAKLVAAIVVAYALSPIDLIPDFIPVLGLLDDLVLVPLGLWLALRLIPPDILAEHRMRVAVMDARGLPPNRSAAFVVVSIWMATALLAVWWLTSP